jgi:crotonobetainyl-CoA:carnitine CoA-transferase CaiB-like acyl-CoA transferase
MLRLRASGGSVGESKLSGVRVLEVAEYAVAPSATAVLAAWGADVVKVEHATRGDALRGLTHETGPNAKRGFVFESVNQGKRSVGLNLAVPAAREIVSELARRSDVFVCNFLPATRLKYSIDVEHIRLVNPSIVYARSTAYGTRGDQVDKRGFDRLTYWYGSGAATSAMTSGAQEPVPLPGHGFGDVQAGMALAGGIAAALYHRERTGEGSVVDVSLLSAGVWAMSAELVSRNLATTKRQPWSRTDAINPLHNTYRTADDRFLALNMLQADKYWSELTSLLGRKDLTTDPRFETMDSRTEHRHACIAEFDAIFGCRTLAQWQSVLATFSGAWGVLYEVEDLNEDESARQNGYVQEVDRGDGHVVTMAAPPVQFDESPPSLRAAPEHAAHTEEVLCEIGYDWDSISRLKDSGAIT